MKRRKFVQVLGFGALVSGAAVLGVYATQNFIEVVEIPIALPGLVAGLDGLRVAQISDLHMGGLTNPRLLEHCVEILLEMKPDLLLITGDFLTDNGDLKRALEELSPLAELTRVFPVMSIMGNHDHLGGEQELRSFLEKIGVQELQNIIVPFRRAGAVLHIAGCDSVSTGHQRLDMLDQAVPEGEPVLLMAHEPDMAQFSAPTGKFAMQVSGHSHGGQVRLPGIGSPMLPWMGQLYPAGLYRVSNMILYTNCGLGVVRVPFRFNCPPEIALFTFRSKK